MELEKLKSVRTGNKSVITRLFRKLDEARENRDSSEFDTKEVISTFERITQKRTLIETLNEQILELTGPEDVEAELLDSEEYYLNLDTKI